MTKEKTAALSYILITGATGGLGSAFARECAMKGYNIVLTDQHPSGVDFSRRLHGTYGCHVVFIQCNLTDPEDRKRFYGEMHRRGMRFSGLINVAGLDKEGGVLERSREDLLEIIRVNIESTIDTTRAVLDMRDEDGVFRLITVSSLASFYSMPFKAVYAASKRFLLDFSLALREEIRPFGSVTVLCPGGMMTNRETIRSIISHGFWGRVTTLNTREVARITMKAAWKGRRIVVPGIMNRFILALSRIVPERVRIRTICRHWRAHRLRMTAPTGL